MVIITGRVLCMLLLSPNGFMLSLLSANRTFLFHLKILDDWHKRSSIGEHQKDVEAFRQPLLIDQHAKSSIQRSLDLRTNISDGPPPASTTSPR
jgi:hypothetical protein